MGYVRGEAPGQTSLFPPSLDELVPADHPVRVIEAYVSTLDLGQLGFERTVPAATGRPGYDPADLLKLYLYGYLNRIRSSRLLERECSRNVEVMWLLGRLAPDFKTIADFRRCNGEGFMRVCRAFVHFCREAQLIGAELVSIDGSKFKAVASRTKVLTPKALAEHARRLDERIGQYLKSLDEADSQEPGEPIDRAAVIAALEKLRERKADCDTAGMILMELDDTQHVAGEPEARLMRSSGTREVSYNVQTAVDAKHGLIVHHEVTNAGADTALLEPVAKGTQRALGADELTVVADTGYSNGAQFAACEAAGITPFVPPKRVFTHRHADRPEANNQFQYDQFKYDAATDTYRCPEGKVLTFAHSKDLMRAYATKAKVCRNCPQKSSCTSGRRKVVYRHVHEDAFERMTERLAARPDMMKRRQALSEHPFAQLKHGVLGNGRFLLRGLRGASIEMALAVMVRNLKRVMNILGKRALITRLASD